MAPPKTDAFADLFLSATSNSSSSSLNEKRMPMLHRQNRQQSPLNGSNLQSSSVSGSHDHWSNLDILSGSHTPTGSSNHTVSSAVDDDPFSIFGKPEPPKTAAGLAEPTPTHQSTIGAPDQLTLLLDDEFSDAFPAEKAAIPAENAVPERLSSKIQPSKLSPEPSSSPNDSVLAQLVDIGFSVDTANDAIARKGPHLQECVNYIMSGGNSETTSQPPTPVQRHPAHHGPEDLQAKLTDLSTDFFNKASIFFDKSKKTVMKNLDQFQQQHMAHRLLSPGMPSWMANQEKYKKDAVERKANGGSYEDYGSDEDNLDKEAIEQFMRKQQERDKERKEKRLQGIKEYAMDRVSGRPESALGRTSPAKKPDMPIRPQLQPSSDDLPRRPPRRTKVPTPKAPVAVASKSPEEDLLGLNSLTSVTAAPLNEFQQTDFDTNKEKASVSFSHGDYDSAYQSYLRCMESLPENHDYRIVINSNAALTLVKMGNYKEAKNHCDIGIRLLDVKGIDNGWTIMDKSAKHWYTKLLMRKAESLEMLEVFPEALECYMELVSRLGVSDKKVMDGKRRVNDIVNPKPKPTPKPTPKAAPKATPKAPAAPKPSNPASNLTRIQKQNAEAKAREEEMFKLHDKVHEQLQAWSNGKEDNIRTLLTTLPDIIPERLGFPFVSDKKIGLGDLMLPKKVKINYMKVISAIHPDKLSNLQLQDKMICQGVFVVLNKAWDTFKQQNNMA